MSLPSIPNPFFDVVVLGGGFAGTLTAIQLLRPGVCSIPSLRIALVEESGDFGPGIAYGRGAGDGLLNVGAANMGAFPDAPGDFLRWAQERSGEPIPGSAFLPRRLYGDYIEDLLRQAREESPHALVSIAGRAVDVAPLPDGTLSVALGGDRFLYAGKVVLAVGNFSPPPPSGDEAAACADPRYLANPWCPETVERLAEPGDVLIVGTGLTCLDYLCVLSRRKAGGTIHVLSRRGLFPLAHPPASVPFKNEGSLEPGTLRELLRAVRRKIKAGAFWRDVIDSLRPQSQALWQYLSVADRRRFLRHLRPYWDTARHRAPAESIALKDRLEAEGLLVCHKGRIASIEAGKDGGLDVTYHPRGTPKGEARLLRVRYVANGTGVATDCLRTGDPLVRNLLDRGLARPDALRLGFAADPGGRLLPAREPVRSDSEFDHEIFALGSIRRGSLWETTAVRELRQQAAEIAARIRGEPLAATAAHASAETALLFDI